VLTQGGCQFVESHHHTYTRKFLQENVMVFS